MKLNPFKRSASTSLADSPDVQDVSGETVSIAKYDESVLQQGRFWMKTVTWTLIGTTVFGVAWLALARTEEIVVAQGKLAQALMYGAEIISIKGNFDKALEIVRELSSKYPIELVNSVNPYRIQGQKTAAFEIVDDLGFAPDWLCIPMGNAGNITAYWLGFKEYSQIKRNSKLPTMMGFQSEGSAPLVNNIIV